MKGSRVSLKDALEVLDKLSNIATLSGLRSRINEDEVRLEMGFGLPDNRSQIVYARPSARKEESVVVTLFAPCLIVKKGLMSGISKNQALDLLKRNENTLFARYGIWSTDKADMIVASVDHLLDSLDPEEFMNSAFHVAVAADEYEKEHGKDDF